MINDQCNNILRPQKLFHDRKQFVLPFIYARIFHKSNENMNLEATSTNDKIYDKSSLIDKYSVLHILFIHLPITIGDVISDCFQVRFKKYLMFVRLEIIKIKIYARNCCFKSSIIDDLGI